MAEMMLGFLGVPLAIVVGGLVARSSDQTARLRRIERKLEAVLNHLGVEVDDRAGLSTQARFYADRGQKIAAIREHRQETGVGLAEAKEVVEDYLSQKARRD